MFFTTNEIEAVLQKVIDNFLIPRFRELDMNATGEWLSSLEVESGNDNGKIRGRDYSEYLTKGRRPGGLPPINQLVKWVNAKLGIYGQEATSAAWAISKKIQKEGTSWYKKGGSDLLEVLEEPKTIQFIQDELGAIATVKITEQLQRNAINAFS
ncbi:MAG: hypothetical protein ACRC8Z_03620 [Empedobacter falsenii]